jgi:hypothetical protein
VTAFGMCAKAQQCYFEVTDAKPSISGTTVTITVSVAPTSTPSERGWYTVVVKPQGKWSNILDSQSKSTSIFWDGSWSYDNRTVVFYCKVDDNTYNQCNSSDFIVSKCFKQQ